jgi:hypothetical protein
MKPRIRLCYGRWLCDLPMRAFSRSGFGSTPQEAYRNWLAKCSATKYSARV